MTKIKVFQLFQIVIASVCVIMPLILFWSDKTGVWRHSISNYVYESHSYVFGMMLTMASMLFLANGALYFSTDDQLDISWHGRWYNVVLGIALLLVVCFPHLQFPVEHYTVAIIFFAGNAAVTVIFSTDKHRLLSAIIAGITLGSFMCVYFDAFSLLVAEWISLTCIAIHFILQANADKL